MKEFPKNVGFVYGYEPSGHYFAAIAVSQFIPSEIATPRLISISDVLPNTSNFIVKSYLEIIQKTPLLWDYLYDNPIISKTYYGLGIKLPDFYINSVIKKLIKYGIDTIISTHSFSSIITSKQNIKIKIKNNFAVITDIYAHSFWPKNLDMYFVPHYQTYKTLVENGVDSDRIDVCGMPLRKEFYLDYNTEKLKKKLKISSHPTFLITGGSKGIGDIIDVVKIFREIKTKSNVLVFCGSNKKLKKELSYMKYINNVKIYPLGYQKNPALYYAISDMIIGKSGGITIFEVASMKKVFTIYSPLPGQEERNAKFLLNHHSALNPSNPRSLKSIIESFLSNPHYFERYRVNISKLHRKDAPIKISNFIINSI